jgi:hypothetical protein
LNSVISRTPDPISHPYYHHPFHCACYTSVGSALLPPSIIQLDIQPPDTKMITHYLWCMGLVQLLDLFQSNVVRRFKWNEVKAVLPSAIGKGRDNLVTGHQVACNVWPVGQERVIFSNPSLRPQFYHNLIKPSLDQNLLYYLRPHLTGALYIQEGNSSV